MNFPLDENLFYSAPSQPIHDQEEEEDALAYEEPPVEELLPPPDFKPFFTLIEDPQSGAIQHPTVHYMFSDDDAEMVTSAALHALDTDENTLRAAEELETRERCVIIDVAADGKTVTSVSSLSLEWQALRAEVTQAPNLAYTTDTSDKRLMLAIAGQEHADSNEVVADTRTPKHAADLEGLLRGFDERLHGLDEVLDRTQSAESRRQPEA